MLESVLPKGTSRRGIAFGLAGFLAVAVVVNLMPGPGTAGTPGAILFLGIVSGLLQSLVAAGIILVYRTSRIINFAQASIGAAGGVFTYNLATAPTTHAPYLVAFAAGVIVAAFLGFIIEIAFVRRFFNAPRLVLTVVTIALIEALRSATGFVGNLPIFGDRSTRSPLDLSGATKLKTPFASFHFQIGTLPLKFGFGHLFAIGVSVLAIVGLALFLRYSRQGIATRAAAENSERAMLLGINVKGLSTIVWVITGTLSGIGIILAGTIGSFQNVGATSLDSLLGALAAAVIARMRSLPVAFAAAIGIEVVRRSIQFKLHEFFPFFNALLFLTILIGLLFQSKEFSRSEDGEASSWKATQEYRPIPKELLAITGVRTWRRVIILLVLLAAIAYPFIMPTGPTVLAGFIAIAGICMLSLVVLTGWAGQVSLGQWGLVAFGALMGGALTSKGHFSFWLALLIVPISTAAFSVLIGLPALRIKGLFLAITTFAFAFAVEATLFSPKIFGKILPERIDRPGLFIFNFEDERSMYFLTLFALVITAFVVVSLRRSRSGRVLIALRENESNVQSFGVPLVRTKLAAFALAGFLSGFAGVLLAHHQRAVTKATFPAVESLNIFMFAVIGGIGSVSGALLGALYFALTRIFAGNQILQLIIGPIGLLTILYVAPGGLASIFYGMRDSILRIVAQRRQMVVPSLFADVDPEALENRLAPLGEFIPGSGLGALPFGQRYRSKSELYRGKGKANNGHTRAPSYLAAIGAASESLEGSLSGSGKPPTEEVPT